MNGEEGRFIQTFKQAMKCMERFPKNVSVSVNFCSPTRQYHVTTGQPPSFFVDKEEIDLVTPSLLMDKSQWAWQLVENQPTNVPRYVSASLVMVGHLTHPRFGS